MNNKGITLITIVITIVVMLIVAGVVIRISFDEGGIFGKVSDAVDKWDNSVKEEDENLNGISGYLEENPNDPPGSSGDIEITPVQNVAAVDLGFIVPGSKSVAESTKDEKLAALLEVLIDEEKLSSDATIDDVKDYVEAYDYEEWIEVLIDDYEIDLPSGAGESEKLQALLPIMIDDGYEVSTVEELEDMLNSWAEDGETELENWLEDYEIEYTGEKATITVTLGGVEVPVQGRNFFAKEEGTYTITVTTESGITGQTTITVDYGGLTPLFIGKKSLLYDSSLVTTWNDLITSEYNTLNLEEHYDGYFAQKYFVKIPTSVPYTVYVVGSPTGTVKPTDTIDSDVIYSESELFH